MAAYKKKVNDTEFIVTKNWKIPRFLGKHGCMFTKNMTKVWYWVCQLYIGPSWKEPDYLPITAMQYDTCIHFNDDHNFCLKLSKVLNEKPQIISPKIIYTVVTIQLTIFGLKLVSCLSCDCIFYKYRSEDPQRCYSLSGKNNYTVKSSINFLKAILRFTKISWAHLFYSVKLDT